MSSADQIALVVHTLGFNKRQLAELFGVSRQAIYDWLKGGNVSEENARKLSLLAELLSVITANTRRPLYHRFTTQPLSPGEPSILELLQNEPWDREHIVAQLRRARDLTTERQARHGSPRGKNSEARDDANLLDNLLSLGEG
jgi:transcriptional regulator with XRE-family HTH domain